MRKAFAIAAFVTLVGGTSTFASDVAEIPFVPMNPEIMGRGGSFIADAHGYDSFFYNPAGFSRDGGSFTLLSASSWAYARPDELLGLAQHIMGGTDSEASTLSFLNDQVTRGGFGIGFSAGIGYVGNGLGLGMVIIEDSLLYGPTLLGASGDLTATIGFIGGLSVPFDLLGFKVHVGGALRPMIRVHALLTNSVAMEMLSSLAGGHDWVSALNDSDALYGVGIGIDVGAIAELGWFTLGLSIRDLAGTQFKYDMNTFGTLSSTFGSQMRFPDGTAADDTYAIPMDIGLGLAFHPDLGSFTHFLDPSMSLDLRDIGGILGGGHSAWTRLHVGAELKMLSLFTFRAGLNEGYFTMGAGVKLLVLDLNFALFTRELGAYIGDRPSSGATFDVAIRW